MPARKRSRITKRDRGLKPTAAEVAARRGVERAAQITAEQAALRSSIEHPLVQRGWDEHQAQEQHLREFTLSRLSPANREVLVLVAAGRIEHSLSKRGYDRWIRTDTAARCTLSIGALAAEGWIAFDGDEDQLGRCVRLTVKGQYALEH